MSLFVDVSVTGFGGLDRVDCFMVTNRGHPGGHCRDDDCDLRDYKWSWDQGGIVGWVQHRRRDGALKLVQIALNSMLGDENYVH